MWHVCGKGKVHTGVLMGKLEGKRRHARNRLRWEDNIKVDVQER